MHTLWSRAAQAHVCRCRACLHTAGGSVARRRVSVAEAFTACYTTVLGTAAVLDARYKDERRRDLGRRVEGAGAGLARLAREPHGAAIPPLRSIALDPELLLPGRFPGVVQTLKSICLPFSDLLAQRNNAEARRTRLQELHRALAVEERLGETLAALKGVNLEPVEDALASEEGEGAAQLHREPLTSMQFSLAINALNQMVDELIMEAYHLEHPDDPEAVQRSIKSLDSAWTAIRMLRSDGYPNYNHPEVDPASTQEARQHLNQVNRGLFRALREERQQAGPRSPAVREALRGRTKFLVAKICYNLLVSPVPPSIHSYNALLLGFTRVGEHSLGKIVARTLLKSSRMRPTQQTLVCLLHHYRATDDIRGFYRILRRLIGLDVRGVHIRRKLVDEVSTYPDLQLWARRSDVAKRGPYLVQRARRDDALYEAIIKGLLHFDRVVDASKVFMACLAERCSISTSTLIQMLKQALYTLDQPAARIIARGLLSHINWTVSLLLDDDCPRKLAEDMYPLLSLCAEPPHKSAPGPGAKEAGSLALLSQQSTPNSRLSRRLERLSAALLIRDAENRLHRLRHVLQRMERRMRDASLPPAETAARAVRELKWLDGHYASLAAHAASYGRLLRANGLAEQVWRAERDARRLEFQLVNILCKTLPKSSGCRAVLQRHDLPVRARVRAYMAAAHHGGIAVRAEQALAASEGLQNALKHALLSSLGREARDGLLAQHGRELSLVPVEAILERRSRRVAAEGRAGAGGDAATPARERWSSRLGRAVPDFRARTPEAPGLLAPSGSWWAPARKAPCT